MPSRTLTNRLALLLLTVIAGCRTSRFPQYPPGYREYAYVANSGGDTVSVLDLVHLRPQATLLVGPHPTAVLASPAVNEVYVAVSGSKGVNGGRGSLAIVDAETNRIVARLPLGVQPSAMAVDDDHLYVANAGANNISVIDLHTRKLLGVVGVGEHPAALAISPDRGTLIVANRGADSISLLSLNRNLPTLRATFNGCPGASSLAVLPDSSKVLVACTGGHQVMVVGLQASPGRRARPEPVGDRLLTFLDVGSRPVHLALKPDGGEIFVSNQGSDTLSEIATGTSEVGGASLIGASPVFAIASQDNALLWVANQDADTVAVYSIDDGKLINTVHTGSAPGTLAFSADGHLLLAADVRSGDVSVLRTFSRDLHRRPVYGTLFTLLASGPSPSAIAVKAFTIR